MKLFKSEKYFTDELITFFENSKLQELNWLPNPYY